MASLSLMETLQKHASLTEAETWETALLFRQKSIRKGGFLLREGEVAHDVFFLTKGLVRQYYTTGSGTEHVCTFNLPGQFVTNLESFIQKAPSNTAIDALTEVECQAIFCEALTRLMADRPAVAGFFHSAVEQVAVENANRVRKLLSQSAEEK